MLQHGRKGGLYLEVVQACEFDSHICGLKFIENKSYKDLNRNHVNEIKKNAFKYASNRIVSQNKRKVRKMKNRK